LQASEEGVVFARFKESEQLGDLFEGQMFEGFYRPF